ncbi:hypothetical protein [Novacetimonas hansenii]|uniref:hypothetical protein n=1 Tax=Novacetimonas hansenii TaxID=436 RepID=UPI000D7C83CC|nr:hypothetical protein [Novacetimonas hansenii]PYD73398.1 hypothetical protein CFR74_04565 [Novacetimonas hansenii]
MTLRAIPITLPRTAGSFAHGQERRTRMRHAWGMLLATTCAVLTSPMAHAQEGRDTRETFSYQAHTIGLQVDARGNGYITVMDKNVSSALKMRDPHIIQVFELRDETVAVLRGRHEGCDRSYEVVSLWDGHHLQTDRLAAPCVDHTVTARDADSISFSPTTPPFDTIYVYQHRRIREFRQPGLAPDTSASSAAIAAAHYVPVTRLDHSVVENPSDPLSPLSQKWLDDPTAYAQAAAAAAQAQQASQVAQAPAAPARPHRVVHHHSAPVAHMEKIPLSIPHADETDTSQPVKLDLTQ